MDPTRAVPLERGTALVAAEGDSTTLDGHDPELAAPSGRRNRLTKGITVGSTLRHIDVLREVISNARTSA